LAAQGAGVCVSPLVIDELWWALFRVFYRQRWGRNFEGDEYKRDPGIWRDHWPAVHRISDEILTWDRLTVLDEAPGATIATFAVNLIDKNPLGPRDAFHLAIALHHGIPAFVIADSDFDAVQLPPGRKLAVIRI